MGSIATQYVMPFQQNGQTQFTSVQQMMHPNPPPSRAKSSSRTDPQMFFNRKVVKPVRGGGLGKQGQPNPFQTKSSQGMNFQDFMQKQKQKKGNAMPVVLGNMNVPLVKPEDNRAFKQQLAAQQLGGSKQKNEEVVRQAKKAIY